MIVKNLSRIRMARRSKREESINLAQRRLWFAVGDGQQGEGDAGNQGGSNGKTPIESLPADVQDYIKSLREEAKTYRESKTALQQQVDAVKQAQQDQLKKQGNFEALAQERAAEVERLKAFEERAATYEKVIRDGNAKRIESIPDTKKQLVLPLVDALSPEKLQEYLNANPDLFVKTPAPNYDGGAGVGGSGGKGEPKVTDEDRRQAAIAQANGHNVKPEDIAKRRVEMTKAANNGDK